MVFVLVSRAIRSDRQFLSMKVEYHHQPPNFDRRLPPVVVPGVFLAIDQPPALPGLCPAERPSNAAKRLLFQGIYNRHIHGEFIRHLQFFLPVRRLFRPLFLEKLAAAHDAGRCTSRRARPLLADRCAFAAFLAPLESCGWFVYAKRPF